MNSKCLIFLTLLIVLISCKSNQSISTEPKLNKEQISNAVQTHPILSQHFTGFVLHDPIAQKDVININGAKLFTPASNTKLLTYYAAQAILGDSIPALSYMEHGDSLIIRGTGDPIFLSQYDQDSVVFKFIKSSNKSLYFDKSNFRDKRFGSGWAWDDYMTYYQKEITPMPIHFNGSHISTDSNAVISLDHQSAIDWIKIDTTLNRRWYRPENENEILINPKKMGSNYSYDIPIRFGDSTFYDMLSSATNKRVEVLAEGTLQNSKHWKTLYHTQADSLYKSLMTDSDNYVAEQLLLCISHELHGYLDASTVIDSLNRSIFLDAPDTLRWVDGSGLSRYNLISPNRLIWVLSKVQQSVDLSEIAWTFPSGESHSTLDTIFLSPHGRPAHDTPFIYAKTGTLSNNHNMSGYINTRNGRTLLFSFMNNHYTVPNHEIRKAMHEILSIVYELM